MITVINFKTYKQGKNVLKLAKAVEKVDKKIIVGVQATDVYRVVNSTKLEVYCQHVDYFEKGRNTGFILPEAVKENGGKGVFLNHSEHKVDFSVLKKTIKRCKKVGLKTMVFAENLRQAKNIEKLNPDYLIFEPPELIAGDVSVSKEEPDLIKKISKKLKTKFLVGAGIKTKKDIEVALELGASGVAFSSVITKAKNPEKVLKGLLN